MKNYFKKFSIMFVMSLAIIGIGMIYGGNGANADDSDYVLKKDYSQNLVVNYKLNETSGTTCIDSTGNYNCTYTGTTIVTDVSQGSTNTYRTFNGSSDFIKTNHNIIPAGKKTIQFKIKTTQTSIGTIYTNTNQSNGTETSQFTINNDNNGKIRIAIENSNTIIAKLTSNKSINDGKWHTVMATYDTYTLNLYIDNMVIYDCSTAVSGSEPTYNSVSIFGFYFPQSDFNRYFKGALDDIAVYNDVVEYRSKDESIALDKSIINLTEGDSGQLTAMTTPASVGVTWTSSDPSIATIEVDPTNGKLIKVNAIKEGTCTITATTADGSNLSASCIINVAKKTEPIPTPDPQQTDTEYITNIAHAKGTNTNNPGGEVTIIFHGTADTILSIVKTADVKDVWVGDNFTYTLVITNTGTKTAKSVVVNDPAPNHIDFNVSGVTTTQGTVDSSSTSKNIIVNVGDILPEGTVTIKIPSTVIL